MTLRNRFYNWIHRVKRLNRKGCKNCGVLIKRDWPYPEIVTKYDWSKPFVYRSEMYEISEDYKYKKVVVSNHYNGK